MSFWTNLRQHCLPPVIRQEENSVLMVTDLFHYNLSSDSVATCPTQPSRHPSGTSSERMSPLKKPRLGILSIITQESSEETDGFRLRLVGCD